MKEILARQLILKNIYAMAYKKTHTRNLITKKNSCGSKIALPPHNFSNGLSLMCRSTKTWNRETETEREYGMKYQW